jgi:hypothetical protein
VTQEFNNRENQWGTTGTVPSGWGHVKSPGSVKQVMHYFYEKLQHRGSGQEDKKGRLDNHD